MTLAPSLATLMRRHLRRALGGIAAANSLAACGGSASSAGAETGHALLAVRVATAVAQRSDLAIEVTVTGTVVARPGSFATLSASAPTRVLQVLVAPGERVRAGQPLLVFDRAPFEAAYQQAAAAAQSVGQAYTRAERLVLQGIWPRREVEQARAARAQAEGALTMAKRGLDFSTLRTPLAGVVSRLTTALDASVDPTQPLVEVVNPEALEVRLALTPVDAARVRPGAPVTFTADGGANGQAESLGSGLVTTIAPTVDSLTGAVDVRARLTLPTRLTRLGEMLSARVQTDVHVGALTIPVVALVPVGDLYQVFVVVRGDTARARPVTVGRRTDRVAEILAGLVASDVVVTDGAYGVEDGSLVRATSTVPPRLDSLRPGVRRVTP